MIRQRVLDQSDFSLFTTINNRISKLNNNSASSPIPHIQLPEHQYPRDSKMPPKSKKEQEEEARRLEQERKKKEEEEMLLELQRKKYASEPLPETGLVLPFTSLFLQQFPHKPLAFANEHIRKYLDTAYASVGALPHSHYQAIAHQILLGLRFIVLNLDLNSKDEALSKKQYQEARVMMGIIVQVISNNNPWMLGNTAASPKTKESDEALFKQLVLAHSTERGQGTKKVLSKDNVKKLIRFMERGYFGHYVLINHWWQVEKREETVTSVVYVDRPTVVWNELSTAFTDLSLGQGSATKAQ